MHDSPHDSLHRRPRGLSRRLPQVLREGDRSAPRSLGRAGLRGPRRLEQGGRQRLPVRDAARGVRRLRRRQALFGGPDGGAGARRLDRHRLRPAQRDRRAVHPALRHRGAEEEIPAQAGERRDGGRDRHERAGRRQRPAGHQEHRHQAGRRQLPAQRQQDLHHQRLACRPGDRGRQDRARRRRQGHQPVAGRARHEGLRDGQAPEEAGPEGAGHLANCSSTTCACRPRTCWAARHSRTGLHLPDGAAAVGAHADRGDARWPRRRPRSTGPCNT